jgi:hypothetical protein
MLASANARDADMTRFFMSFTAKLTNSLHIAVASVSFWQPIRRRRL